MLAIDASGMALLSALVEALPHPVYVQEIGSGAFLFGNRLFRETFPAPPQLAGEGEFHDAASDRWYVLRTHPLTWIDGRSASLCVLSDVTDQRRARELVAKHRDAPHRTARLIALGEFASAVAHELNQPLAAIAEQDLNELVEAVLELSEPGAREAGVSFRRELSPAPPLVRADRLLIEQAALNLVRNAVEAVQELAPHRRCVTVATRVERDGSGTLEVSDLGEGLPPEVREHLFDAFVTTKRGGLGLGLSICRSVIEAHGGTIRHEEN